MDTDNRPIYEKEEGNHYDQNSQTGPSTQDYEENLQEKAGCLGIGFSFLFPIIGVIIYFVERKKVANATTYLIAAAIGFGLSIILQIVSAELMS